MPTEADELREVLRLLLEAIERGAFDYENCRENPVPLLGRAYALIEEPAHG